MHTQRRRSERTEAHFLVAGFQGPLGFDVPGEATKIALHGLFFKIAREARVGQLVRMKMHLQDGQPALEWYAFVRHCQPGQGMGLELFAMTERERERWIRYYYGCLANARRT